MYPYIKRILDVILSLAAIIILSPLLLILAVLVRCRLGKPVLFRQERPGLHAEIFTLYKFRSMKDVQDSSGRELPDEERLTSFGKKLRATSLDELPELFNILKGDMSLVGPRPLLVEYLPLYSKEQAHRHDVRPGLTGLAQVKGRNALTWPEKFKYDLKYVQNMSFSLDCRIIWETISVVFKHEGIHAQDSATMEPFHGEQ